MKHIKRTKHGLVEKKVGRKIVSPLNPMVSNDTFRPSDIFPLVPWSKRRLFMDILLKQMMPWSQAVELSKRKQQKELLRTLSRGKLKMPQRIPSGSKGQGS